MSSCGTLRRVYRYMLLTLNRNWQTSLTHGPRLLSQADCGVRSQDVTCCTALALVFDEIKLSLVCRTWYLEVSRNFFLRRSEPKQTRAKLPKGHA